MREELISEAVVEKILGWRHTGFSVHSQVRAMTREEAERVGKYMIRPLLSLERLSLDERDGKVCYRIINHLKLTFAAERPAPPHLVPQEFLMAAETGTDSHDFLLDQAEVRLIFGFFRASLQLMRRFGPPGATSGYPWHLFCHYLYFSAMVEGENGNYDVFLASVAEKKFLIFLIGSIGFAMGEQI